MRVQMCEPTQRPPRARGPSPGCPAGGCSTLPSLPLRQGSQPELPAARPQPLQGLASGTGGTGSLPLGTCCVMGTGQADLEVQAHLLQRGRAELDGDVVELLVPLGAEVAHDVGVLVRLAEQLHLPVHQVETLGQEALHGHAAAIEVSPVCTPPVMAAPTTRHSRAQRCRGTAQTGSGRCQARPSAPSA